MDKKNNRGSPFGPGTWVLLFSWGGRWAVRRCGDFSPFTVQSQKQVAIDPLLIKNTQPPKSQSVAPSHMYGPWPLNRGAPDQRILLPSPYLMDNITTKGLQTPWCRYEAPARGLGSLRRDRRPTPRSMQNCVGNTPSEGRATPSHPSKNRS